MAKQEAEWSNRLSIFWLKKYGYLDKDYSFKSGGIKWTYGLSENQSSIGFTVTREDWKTPEEKTFIELSYSHTNRESGEKEDIKHKIELATTPCNLGGVRYWFICPLWKKGQYCGKRVGVLYGIGKYFGCRHCGEIAYASQMKSGRFRGGSISIPDIERLEKEIKRHYYKGKPTRKHLRLVKMNNKFNRDFILMVSYLDKRLGRSI